MNENRITQFIKEKLSQIEERESIRIIYACESGSRAYGLANSDSDYDVRFVYIRPKEFYLRLENANDTLECELNDVYDISGWDLKKLLKLLNRSNPSIFEWAASPIVYKTTDEWKTITQILNNHFSEIRVLHHYNSMTKNDLKRGSLFSENVVEYKSYLYILRQVLSCEWILDRKSPPPIVFDTLRELYLPLEFQNTVNNLVELRKSMSEKKTCLRIKELDSYINSVVYKVEKYLKFSSANEEIIHVLKWSELNETFLKLLE